MSAITKLHRQLVKRFEAVGERLKELDIAGTDDEVAALLSGLIGPGIGGNLDSIESILDTVAAYTGDAEDGDADTDSDDDDDDDTDEFAEDGDDADDDDEFGDADDDDADTDSDDDDDDFADDGDDGDDDDFADSDDDDVSVDDDEEEEEAPAPRRKPGKPAPKTAAPVKPTKPAPKAQAAVKPAAKPAGNGKVSKAMQKLQAMNTAELKAHLLEGFPKRAAAIEAAIANVGGRAKAAALLAFAVKKAWVA